MLLSALFNVPKLLQTLNYELKTDYGVRPWTGTNISPSAIQYQNKTYIGYLAETNPQTTKIMAYDHTTGNVQINTVDLSFLSNDTHGQVSLAILTDGRLVCMYGSHISAQQWAISGQINNEPDIDNWTVQTPLSGSYTYPKLINMDNQNGTSTLWLGIRGNSNGNDYTYSILSATYTPNSALSFTTEEEIIDYGGRVYAAELKERNGDLEIICTRANTADTVRRHIFYYKYLTATNEVQDLSGLNTFNSAQFPIQNTNNDSIFREFENIAPNILGVVTWCRDSNDNLHVVFGDDDASIGSLFNIKHMYYDGSSWNTPTVIFQTERKASQFADVYCVFSLNNGNDIEVWFPQGVIGGWTGRGGDFIKRIQYISGSWSSEQTIYMGNNGLALAHPTPVINSNSDMKVIFTEVAQTSLESDAEFLAKFGYGDNGLIVWPQLSEDPYRYQVCLDLSFDGTHGSTNIVDSSHWSHLHNVTVTGSTQLDSTKSKFGTTSLRVSGGNGARISRANNSVSESEFRLRAGDSIEMFINVDTFINATQYICSTRASSTGFAFVIDSSKVLRFVGWGSSGVTTSIYGTTVLAADTWYHIIAYNSGSGIEVYLDGNLEVSGGETPRDGLDLFIGYNPLGGGEFNGYISNFRFTKQVHRTIEVPVAPYPQDSKL